MEKVAGYTSLQVGQNARGGGGGKREVHTSEPIQHAAWVGGQYEGLVLVNIGALMIRLGFWGTAMKVQCILVHYAGFQIRSGSRVPGSLASECRHKHTVDLSKLRGLKKPSTHAKQGDFYLNRMISKPISLSLSRSLSLSIYIYVCICICIYR